MPQQSMKKQIKKLITSELEDSGEDIPTRTTGWGNAFEKFVYKHFLNDGEQVDDDVYSAISPGGPKDGSIIIF